MGYRKGKNAAFIPKTQVSVDRLLRYKAAWRANQASTARGDDLSFSEWIREALDAQSDEDLAED